MSKKGHGVLWTLVAALLHTCLCTCRSHYKHANMYGTNDNRGLPTLAHALCTRPTHRRLLKKKWWWLKSVGGDGCGGCGVRRRKRHAVHAAAVGISEGTYDLKKKNERSGEKEARLGVWEMSHCKQTGISRPMTCGLKKNGYKVYWA